MNRYRFNDFNEYRFGTLIKIENNKLTFEMDNGEIRTSPPHHPQFVGTISKNKLTKILKK